MLPDTAYPTGDWNAAGVGIIGSGNDADHRYHHLHDSHHRTTPTPHHHAQQ